MSTNLKNQPSINVNKDQLPQRLHHNARVVKDHERTRQFYQDVIGMPLIATWAEIGQFPDFPERIISYCHTFYGLADGAPSRSLGLPTLMFTKFTKRRLKADLTTWRLQYPPNCRGK